MGMSSLKLSLASWRHFSKSILGTSVRACGETRFKTISISRSPEISRESSNSDSSVCSLSPTRSAGSMRSARLSSRRPTSFSGSQPSNRFAPTEFLAPSGEGRRASNLSHSFEKPHEILLPMRTDDGGRTALLQFLRTELRREIVSQAPRELPARRCLFPVWQPGTLDTTAQSLDVVEGSGVSRKDCLRDTARLSDTCRCHRASQDSSVPDCILCLRHSYRFAVVAVELASGMVQEARPTVSQPEGARP